MQKLQVATLVAVFMVVSTLAVANPFGGHHESRGQSAKAALEALDLDASQRVAVDEIFEQAKAQRKALRKEQRALHKQMRDLDKTALTPQQIDAVSGDVGRLAAERVRQKLNTEMALARVLNNEQMAQWQALQKEQRDARREHWEKHRNGGKPE